MNLLESHGLTRFIALTSLLILPLNLLLDYVFVFGVGPFEGMGGVGCAVTSASLYALWTCCTVCLRGETSEAERLPRFTGAGREIDKTAD